MEVLFLRLIVEDFLGDENGDGVVDCCFGSGYYGDEGVFFFVERIGVEWSVKDFDIRYEFGLVSV